MMYRIWLAISFLNPANAALKMMRQKSMPIKSDGASQVTRQRSVTDGKQLTEQKFRKDEQVWVYGFQADDDLLIDDVQGISKFQIIQINYFFAVKGVALTFCFFIWMSTR